MASAVVQVPRALLLRHSAMDRSADLDIFALVLIATAITVVVRICGCWSSSPNDEPQDSEEFDVAWSDAEERAEQQWRYENAKRHFYYAGLAMEGARQNDFPTRQRLSPSQTLERARREQEARARASVTRTIARTGGDSVRSVDEWRELAAQSAKSRSEASSKSKAVRERGNEGEARLVSMHGSVFDQFVFCFD